MRERAPFIVTLALTVIAMYVMLHGIMTPDMYRLTDPSSPINYVFVPDDDEYVRSKHHVEGTFWSTSGDSVDVSVFYETRGGAFEEGTLQQIRDSNKFSFPLPSLARGDRFFYFLRARDSHGNEVEIKPKRNLMDKLFARGKEKLFYVTYEGRPPKPLLIFHVGFILGAMLLMLHGFHFSLAHILNGRGLTAAYWTLLAAWVLFTVSVLPLGIVVAKSAFGVGWGGFPLGSDITDNKSLAVVIYWAIVLWRGWKPQRGDFSPRTGKMYGITFAGLSLLGILMTVLIYSIPHSIFVQ
jgi:hypothetical protein